MTPPLKLYARDADDISVISAQLQDAVGQIGDLAYEAAGRRFVFLVNRFCWEDEKTPMRVRSALQIGGVASIQHRKLNMARRDGIVSVLAIRFDAADAPAGHMHIVLSGGGEIRLEVEACEAILEDISAPWRAQSRPAHRP